MTSPKLRRNVIEVGDRKVIAESPGGRIDTKPD